MSAGVGERRGEIASEVVAVARALELGAAGRGEAATRLARLRDHYRAEPALFDPDTLDRLRALAAELRQVEARASSAGPRAEGRPSATLEDARRLLKDTFGHAAFRPGQEPIVEALIAGRDCLGVMPTGAGKSLTYQLPARLLGGTTLVVSPLIALMKDQVDAMGRAGLRATFLNSTLAPEERRERVAALRRGELELVYAAPEGLEASVGGALDGVRLSLIAVDEAHCISQWGHDFRPAYRNLQGLKARFGAPVLALTATATPAVTRDIAAQLGMADPLLVKGSFLRKNLKLAAVKKGGDGPTAREAIARLVRARRGECGIVYALGRKTVEGTAEYLCGHGVKAAAYHAGLEREHRADVQRRFLADELRVICATNAFGMGVDKPNVRTVVHASVPSSLEAYYQEAGRAGRDGAPARALLLAENRDKALHVHFIKREELDPGLPGWLADRLIAAADGEGRYSLDGSQLARDLRGDGERLRALIGHLTRAGVISPSPSAPDRVAGRVTGRFDGRAGALCRTSIEDAASARWRQYREIWAYVEREDCRRAAILRHFGDPAAEASPSVSCCDVCDPALALAPPAPDPVAIGSLDEAILAVAGGARPAVGRTTCAEILHGSRSKKIQRNSYDGLPAYGVSAHMRRADILARVDQLIDEGRLETTGGPYPVLRIAA